MSRDITSMNHGQGFTANLVTSVLVIFASKWGLLVSTTHASVGAIFGIGVVNKRADYQVISKIVTSWFLTLPVAGGIAALAYFAIHTLALRLFSLAPRCGMILFSFDICLFPCSCGFTRPSSRSAAFLATDCQEKI